MAKSGQDFQQFHALLPQRELVLLPCFASDTSQPCHLNGIAAYYAIEAKDLEDVRLSEYYGKQALYADGSMDGLWYTAKAYYTYNQTRKSLGTK